VLKDCKVEPNISNLKTFDRFQFERLGYFCIDPNTTDNQIIINRTVTLRDNWKKIQKQLKEKK